MEVAAMKTDEFWHKILTTTDSKNIAKFALSVLSLPHSNSDCERIFSHVNNIKTKKRNKLFTSTISGLLLTKECIKSNNSKNDCRTFEPTTSMYQKIKDKQKYFLNKNEEEFIESIRDLYRE